MRNANMAAIQRLKKQLRQLSLKEVILQHWDCTERELYTALVCAVQLEGRTSEQLEYFSEHGHFPGGAQHKELHPGWKTQARNDQTLLKRGFRMVEDVIPDIDPAVLNECLNSVRQFRGKSADELGFIAAHGRDPENFAELAEFVANGQLMRPADCRYCRPAAN